MFGWQTRSSRASDPLDDFEVPTKIREMVIVSVVMPTFNRAEFLGEAVSSVLTQTFRELELLIVDDGSTDSTPELVSALRDSRIRYVRQEHRGVSAALNTGWRAAHGELIGRLDSDDRWLPELLATLVPPLHADANIALAYGRAQWMDPQGRLLPNVMGTNEKFPGQTLKSLLYGDFVTPMAVVIKKTCLETVGGYDESLSANEDWDLWIRLAEKYRFAYADRVLAHYRVHSQNLTHSRSEKNARVIQDRIRVLEKYYARPNLSRDAMEVKALAFRNLYHDVAMRHLSARRWRKALTYFGSAVRCAPHPVTAIWRELRDVIYVSSLGKTRWGVQLTNRWLGRQRKQVR